MFDERNIQLTQFIKSRASEIKNFTQILESKYLKRRAMSHNRYRIPRQLRKQMNETALVDIENQQKIVKCRKHIRKARLLQSSYQRRSKNVQWLETHLHQTKRMKMIEYFGFKVALHANEKNWRAVHRFEQHGCCVYDMSYYTTIFIQGQIDTLITFIKALTLKDTLDQRVLDGQSTLDCQMYKENQQIGPGTLLFHGSSQLIIFIHPALDTEMQEMIKLYDLQVSVKKGELSVFQLQGPQQLNLLEQLINILQVNSESEDKYESCCDINYLNFILNKEIKVEQNTLEYKEVKTLDDYLPNMQISIPRAQQNKKQSSQVATIWEFNVTDLDKIYSQRFHTVVRARYTHRKKRKQEFQLLLKEKKKTQQNERLQKIQEDKEKKKSGVLPIQKVEEEIIKLPIPDDQGKKAIRWHLNQTLKIRNKEEEMKEEIQFTTLMAGKAVQNKLSLLIIQEQQNKQSQFSQGIKIFVNLGQGILIWKLLNKLKLKPIGLRDSRQLAMENKIRFYPDDYPYSSGYQVQNQKMFVEETVKTAKSPPAKRINHFELLFPSPFKPLWNLLGHPTSPVYIQAYQGTPQHRSIIVQPSNEDMQQLLEGKFNLPVIQVNQTFQSIKNDGRSLIELQQYELYVSQLKLDRPLIGFITSGNFSNKYGKGIAIGHIIQNPTKVKDLIILYRNPGSQFYYFASCKFM